MTLRPALITGVGAITPLGHDLESSWQELLAGTVALKTGASGLAPVLQEYPVGLAKYEEGIARLSLNPRQLRRLDPISIQAMACVDAALEDAGLETPVHDARVAVVVGVGFGAVKSHHYIATHTLNGKPHKLSPFTIPAAMPNAPACNVSLRTGSRGPTWTTATACAAGLDATGIGLWLLQTGQAEVAFVGGTENMADDIGVGGLGAAKALAKPEGGDVAVVRPFDLNRKGTAVGEGCAMFVLETPEHAEKRGAPVRAQLLGYASGSDAFHITAPRPDGSGAVEVMERALQAAGRKPAEVQAVFAHGTGTPLNDAMEGKAMAQVFGAATLPKMTATKGQYGHAMGASGPINLALAVRAAEERLVPATVTCREFDEECIVRPVMGEAERCNDLECFMVNAFGFGGHNASLVLRRA